MITERDAEQHLNAALNVAFMSKLINKYGPESCIGKVFRLDEDRGLVYMEFEPEVSMVPIDKKVFGRPVSLTKFDWKNLREAFKNAYWDGYLDGHHAGMRVKKERQDEDRTKFVEPSKLGVYQGIPPYYL